MPESPPCSPCTPLVCDLNHADNFHDDRQDAPKIDVSTQTCSDHTERCADCSSDRQFVVRQLRKPPEGSEKAAAGAPMELLTIVESKPTKPSKPPAKRRRLKPATGVAQLSQAESSMVKVNQKKQFEELKRRHRLTAPDERAKAVMRNEKFMCPRCGDDRNTLFDYFNNYTLEQPRMLCRTCNQKWTLGGEMKRRRTDAGETSAVMQMLQLSKS